MSLKEAGIEHKRLAAALVATTGCQFQNRAQLRTILAGVERAIPASSIAGPAFCIFQFVSSTREGFEGEAGFPVRQSVDTSEVKTRILPTVEVLSLVHKGPSDQIRETLATLYGHAAQHGLISDEFMREVYLDSNNPQGNETELQFVLHDWVDLLGRHLTRVLGDQASRDVMRGSDALSLESTADERSCWVQGAMQRLIMQADEHDKADILSSCSHVFPRAQIQKLRAVYESARAEGHVPLDAVDAVREFMAEDPGWGELPRRDGRVVYSTKKPRDAKAFESAKDDAERRRAYCFCPLVRNRLDRGMPIAFCYCGAGWYRQQWEGALGQPVRVEIAESLLKGDERCTFAIQLPDDLT